MQHGACVILLSETLRWRCTPAMNTDAGKITIAIRHTIYSVLHHPMAAHAGRMHRTLGHLRTPQWGLGTWLCCCRLLRHRSTLGTSLLHWLYQIYHAGCDHWNSRPHVFSREQLMCWYLNFSAFPDGVSLLQSRSLVFVPLPHVAEHSLHLPQSLHSSNTAKTYDAALIQ